MGTSALTTSEAIDLDDEDPTGFTQDRIIKLGANISYTFNMGLIYSF